MHLRAFMTVALPVAFISTPRYSLITCSTSASIAATTETAKHTGRPSLYGVHCKQGEIAVRPCAPRLLSDDGSARAACGRGAGTASPVTATSSLEPAGSPHFARAPLARRSYRVPSERASSL